MRNDGVITSLLGGSRTRQADVRQESSGGRYGQWSGRTGWSSSQPSSSSR